MSDGPNKIKLTQYLNGAREGAISTAGKNWTAKGAILQIVSEALQKQGPDLARELGEDSKTADRLTEVLLKSAKNMQSQGAKLEAGGKALTEVSGTLETARLEREAMVSLTAPPPYQPPIYAPGYQPTPDEITKAANDRTASNNEHTTYQSAFDAQETAAAQHVAKLDTAFMSAIPPMMALHGGPDPTAPGPGTPGPGPGMPTTPTTPIPVPTATPTPTPTPTPIPTGFPDVPTTNVQGGTDGGTSYQGINPGGSSTAGSAGSTSAGVGGAAAAGAAGAGLGAGMLKGGAVSGSVRASSTGSVRGIGAGGRAGGPSSLGRGTTGAGSAARGGSSGTRAGGASRSAGAAGTSGAKGSAAKGGARGGATKGAAGRGGAAGSTGKGTSKGKGKGSGLFRRGGNGSTQGGRANKKDDERSTERDSLVYEQDWLGEDTAAPGVLD